MPSRAVVALSLAALAFALYAPVRHHAFVDYDDDHYVFENPNLRMPLDAAAVRRAFLPYETNWIPLTWLSLHLDWRLFGPRPAGYLLENAALHAVSAALLFLALTSLTGAAGRSAFVAAVFAAHPLHVESVAWASERKDVLAGLFWMLGLLAYARHAARRRTLRAGARLARARPAREAEPRDLSLRALAARRLAARAPAPAPGRRRARAGRDAPRSRGEDPDAAPRGRRVGRDLRRA